MIIREWNASYCEVYWGTHVCYLNPGHEGHHVCVCCEDPDNHATDPEHDPGCVGAYPYYGPETRFYGDDVE